MNNFRPNRPNPRSIELHIDELVVHGFPAGDRYVIADAFENELSQLLSNQLASEGVPPSFAESPHHDRLDAGAFDVAEGWTGKSVGRQIAETVHRGISK